MKERVKFVLEWEKRWNAGRGLLNFAELCREFGISRQVGYVWLRRYREAKHNLDALKERTRRPLTSPAKLPDEMEDLLVAARKSHPTWGPEKLRAWLMHYRPQLELPAQSTIGAVLHRRGLTTPRPRRVRATQASTQPFADVTGPHATWCVDFKGHFRTRDGSKCYPLTIIDAHSRFLLRCEVLENPDGPAVQRVFDSAFSEFGLPAAIRSDNGPPFASVGAGGLTKLAVWWLRLGIRLERIEPGKPQQNGRQELFPRAAIRAHYCASQSTLPGIKQLASIATVASAGMASRSLSVPLSLTRMSSSATNPRSSNGTWCSDHFLSAGSVKPRHSASRQPKVGWLIWWRKSSLKSCQECPRIEVSGMSSVAQTRAASLALSPS